MGGAGGGETVAAAKLRELPGQRGRCQVRQSNAHLDHATTEGLDRHHLTALIARAAQRGGHDIAPTAPSRYARTGPTAKRSPACCLIIASTRAAAVSSDVQHGMRRCSAASRMR